MDEKIYEERNRYKIISELLNDWMLIKNRKDFDHFAGFFNNQRINNIAIYAVSDLGLRLYEELSYTNVEVRFFIDRNAENILYKCPIITLQKLKPQLNYIDGIIISNIFSYDKVAEDVRMVTDKPLFSIRDMVNYCE